MAKLFKTDGTVEDVKPKGKKFKLEEMQKLVGGYIEAVPGSKLLAYCNEEGQLQELPFNKRASEYFHQVLVGNVLVCAPGETS